jgi:soluble lytic murein transglycosylase-like protein
MVRALLLAGLMVLDPAGTPDFDRTPDWRGAGGDLFAATETSVLASAPAAVSPSSPTEAARLAPLSQPYRVAIDEAADRHGLDPKLLHALVVIESGYRPTACSEAGACGLAQLMPGTAAELGVEDRFDPVANLNGGADYLARQIVRFGDLRLALAAYNSGPERVARLGRIPQIAETQAYVTAVVDCYLALSAGRRVLSARDCRPGGRP